MDEEIEKIYASKKFPSVFSEISDKCGYIAGLKIKDETYCLTASLCCDYFLTGLEVLGIFYFITDEAKNEDDLIQTFKENFNRLKIELDNPVILMIQKVTGSVILKAKILFVYSDILKDIDIEYFNHNPAILLRAVGKIPFLFETAACSDNLKENIDFAMGKLQMTLGSKIVAFHLKDSKFILTPIEKSQSSYTCGNLHQLFEDSHVAEAFKKNKKCSKRKVPTNFSILLQITGEAAIQNTVEHSLVIHCQQKLYQCTSMNLPLDVLIVCSESSSIYSIYELFHRALQRQLKSMNECLINYAKNINFTTPVPYHFYPDLWELPLTIVYPISETDEELEMYRKNIHKLLLLPLDRPMLRKSNEWKFCDTPGGYIINPHEAVLQSEVGDGKVSTVFGRYTYHHYMQDRMNDNGWGCAYRSLQTIISWFRFQGYTKRDIPTHSEIQQALVDIGDKPKSFVGSQKWIGSQEVSFCLNHLINVQSKILCVSTGSEMCNKGRELFLHFKEQGTPVMIGGGVLAHTIIGVNFNENTGDLMFLILDPHYTGGEDLNTVVNKGWCGWKKINFWDQNAFYNLCLPQRPMQI